MLLLIKLTHPFDNPVAGLDQPFQQAVVMTGNLVDCCEPGKLNEIGVWHKPWFFKHVQGFFETGCLSELSQLSYFWVPPF